MYSSSFRAFAVDGSDRKESRGYGIRCILLARERRKRIAEAWRLLRFLNSCGMHFSLAVNTSTKALKYYPHFCSGYVNHSHIMKADFDGLEARLREELSLGVVTGRNHSTRRFYKLRQNHYSRTCKFGDGDESLYHDGLFRIFSDWVNELIRYETRDEILNY